jgi:hypothetical protein
MHWYPRLNRTSVNHEDHERLSKNTAQDHEDP